MTEPAPARQTNRLVSLSILFSNLLLMAVGTLSAAYCAYSVVSRKSDLLVRLSPAVVGMAAPVLFWFKPVARLTAAATFLGVFLGLYTAQFFALVLIDPDRPTLQAIESSAKETGVRFDRRTRLEAITDYRGHGKTAYPPFYPYHLLDPPLQVESQPTVVLASISNAFTVCCNEEGQYLTYKTDEHGFPNPPGSWQAPVDMAFIGASTAVGESVPPADNLLSQLRPQYPRIVTIAAGGNGPLLELASIREYLPALKPKKVLWMFAESHTPEYLETEGKSAFLHRYLDDKSFRQGLLEKQPQIDRAVARYFEDGLKEEADAESWKTSLKRFLLLKNIRTVLYYVVTARTTPPKAFQFNADLYEQVLREGKREIDEWGGSVTLVYFPDSSRYAGICNYTPGLRNVYDRTHEQVLAVAARLHLPVIDLSKAFPDLPASEASRNFPYFHPFPAHYTPAGYHVAGKAILDALAGLEKQPQ